MRQPASIHQFTKILVVCDEHPLLVVSERKYILIAGPKRHLRNRAYIVAQTSQHPAQPNGSGTLVKQKFQWF